MHSEGRSLNKPRRVSFEQFKKLMNGVSGDVVANVNWVDSSTNDILWKAGTKAGRNPYHPDHISMWTAKKQKLTNDQRKEELAQEHFGTFWFKLSPEQKHELEKVINGDWDPFKSKSKSIIDLANEFAQDAVGLGKEFPGTEEDAAHDMSLNFFYQYPEWQQIARKENLNKDEVLSIVQGSVYEKMMTEGFGEPIKTKEIKKIKLSSLRNIIKEELQACLSKKY